MYMYVHMYVMYVCMNRMYMYVHVHMNEYVATYECAHVHGSPTCMYVVCSMCGAHTGIHTCMCIHQHTYIHVLVCMWYIVHVHIHVL